MDLQGLHYKLIKRKKSIDYAHSPFKLFVLLLLLTAHLADRDIIASAINLHSLSNPTSLASTTNFQSLHNQTVNSLNQNINGFDTIEVNIVVFQFSMYRLNMISRVCLEVQLFHMNGKDEVYFLYLINMFYHTWLLCKGAEHKEHSIVFDIMFKF